MDNDVKDEAYYRKLWTGMFPVGLKVALEDGVLVNEYCPQCRFCCGPQAEEKPFPMALLDRQISARTPDDFYLLDSRTAPAAARFARYRVPMAQAGLLPSLEAPAWTYLSAPLNHRSSTAIRAARTARSEESPPAG